MVHDIGKVGFGHVGRGSIGRASLMPQKDTTEKEKQQKAHRKAAVWRDRARESLLRARDRLRETLLRNEKKTEIKLANRRKNINPSFVPLMPIFSRRGRPTFTLSMVPEKPKYSLIEPKERLYGQKLERVETPKRKLHPAIEAAVKEIKSDVEKRKVKKAEEDRKAKEEAERKAEKERKEKAKAAEIGEEKKELKLSEKGIDERTKKEKLSPEIWGGLLPQ